MSGLGVTVALDPDTGQPAVLLATEHDQITLRPEYARHLARLLTLAAETAAEITDEQEHRP